LYTENSSERKALFSENSVQRQSLLETFDFDEDGKISKEEMEEADTILDSMAE
jgi:Ca2+-binding EF-hand superfamily protein